MSAVPHLVLSKAKRGAAMRKKLRVADLEDLLEQPLNAVLATYLPLGGILRITLRYIGPERTAMYLQELEGINLVYVRLEPGKLQFWDFVDEEVFH